VEQEHVAAFERAADLTGVGAELLDDIGVPIVDVAGLDSS
jgi:hypothetical protein